jgi:RNA polymerase sigma-70 factor (ECF subfamily)
MPDKISESEFGKVIYDNQGLILKVCNIYCRNQSDRDDLFQDIMINLWKGLPSFKGNSKLSTWIYRVSLNTAISKFRKKRRMEFVGFDTVPELKDDSVDEKETDKESSIKALYIGISKLNPVEKAIILLYLEEKTYDEIADITGISKSNVSVRLVRVKRKLETIIKPLLK